MVDQKKNNKTGNEIETAEEGTPKQPDQIVYRYTCWALGAGFIPVSIARIGALMAVQLKMLNRLSLHYGVEFSENRGKSIVTALLGSITADSLKQGMLTKFIKTIPVIRLLAPLTMPVYSAAVTYAVGKLFIHHFESGGTFLDFDTRSAKNLFAELLKEGRTMANDFKNRYA